MPLLEVNHNKRIYGLDILRALAILFVIYAHSLFLLEEFVDIQILRMFQLDGVTIFFVLSGFLIGRILIKVYFTDAIFSGQQLYQFWIRRWVRTIPNYLFVLCFIIGLHHFFPVFRLEQEFDLYKYFLFIQNLWYRHPGFFGEAWSLAVEEWFYLLFPFLLFVASLVLRKNSRMAFLSIVVGFIIFGILYRYQFINNALENGLNVRKIFNPDIRKVVICRLDSIMYGVLGAYIFTFHKAFWNKHKVLFFFFGVASFYIFKLFPWHEHPLFKAMFFTAITSWGTLFLLPQLNEIRYSEKMTKLQGFFMLISLTSYSIYLINLTVLEILDKTLFESIPFAGFQVILFWGLTLFLSIVLYKYLENPILKLRDKYYKKVSI